MARVVVLQPYVPAYRAAFFRALASRLRQDGHELVVASGSPAGVQARRKDAVLLDGIDHRALRVVTIRIGAARLRLTSGRRVWRDADVIVVELAAGATATYEALLQRRRPVAVWGHVEAFVAPDTRTTRALRRWQARRANQVLAYTERGAALASDWGVDPLRIATLNNTSDTATLARLVDQGSSEKSRRVRESLGLSERPVFAMIGGLDASKRVDLVVDTLDLLWESRPEVLLLVAGRGELEEAFDRAAARGQVRLLGHVGDEGKADVASVAIALLNPGRVGLIAVESMAMELPLITTHGARHGPEFDYLSPGRDCIRTTPDAPSLAAEVLRLVDHPLAATRLGAAARAKLPQYSLSRMIDAFSSALLALVQRAEDEL